jgi:iron complex outermembrane receptor protein
VELKLDLSLANRFPNADELYVLGTSPTFPVFAFGAPNLSKERQLGLSPSVGFQSRWITGELSGFSNWIEDYVYFSPELAADGSLAYEVTIRGAYPRYNYGPISAWFYGADGSVTLAPERPVSFQAVVSVVRGRNQDASVFLVGIPSDRLLLNLNAEKEDWGRAQLSTELVAKQSLVDESLDFAPTPDGYVLLHASVSKDWMLGGNQGTLSLYGSNLLNQSYRNYMSLLRYYADEKGRDIRLALSYQF